MCVNSETCTGTSSFAERPERVMSLMPAVVKSVFDMHRIATTHENTGQCHISSVLTYAGKQPV